MVSTESTSYREPIVLLANGPFPTQAVPLRALLKASTRICTDGSVDKLRSHNLGAQVVIGDMDSIQSLEDIAPAKRVVKADQTSTDLEKTLVWCVQNGISSITLVGAIGERDDHSMVTLALMSAFYNQLAIQCITEYSTINCILGQHNFTSHTGQTVSILPAEPEVILSTTNLEYELDRESLTAVSQGISNRSLGSKFSIESSGKIWVFRSHGS